MTVLESIYELGTGLHANGLASQPVGLEKIPNERRVGVVVFEQQNAQQRFGHLFLHAAGRWLVDERPEHTELLQALMNS